MAAMLNKVFLIGNLTRDPDLRSLANGASVCEFGIAMNRRYISNGREMDEACFVDIVVWGKSAENCRQFLEKGSLVMVEGRLQLDQWEDRNGGGKRSRLRVVAEQVQFLNTRRQQNPDGGYGAPAGAQQPQTGGYGNGYQRQAQPQPPPQQQIPPMPPIPPSGSGDAVDDCPF